MSAALAMHSAPSVPFPTNPDTLTNAQIWFLAFHTRRTDPPMRWVRRWGDTLLQASTALGQTATIAVAEFDALVAAGLMRQAPEEFGATITVAGRDAVER